MTRQDKQASAAAASPSLRFGRRVAAAACLAAAAALVPGAAMAQGAAAGLEGAANPAEETPEATAAALLSNQKNIDILASNPELLLRSAIHIRPSTKGDPMVIPFIKEEYLRRQGVEQMTKAYEQGLKNDALRYARYLARTFPGTKEAKSAQTIIEVYEKQDTPEPTEVEIVVEERIKIPELPSWVSTNTRSIIYDAEEPIVQVGFDFYREGQALREYPNIVVEKINPNDVLFKASNEFASKTYAVTIPTE